LVSAAVLIGYGSGCAAPGPRGQIPCGEWSGQGHFVYERWEDSATTQPFAPSVERDYPTRLRIEESELDGHKVVLMEIHSQRGELPELEDETHLLVALEPVRRLSDATTLYRSVDTLLNPGPEERLEYNTPDSAEAPLNATCTTFHDATVLQVHYMKGFYDALIFRGPCVDKTGAYSDAESGLVHWHEQLRK